MRPITASAPNGARLRLNSLCGINLAGHALTRSGRSYDTIYAAPDEVAALDTVNQRNHVAASLHEVEFEPGQVTQRFADRVKAIIIQKIGPDLPARQLGAR